VVTSARSEHDRVILDTEHVPSRGAGGEPGIAVASLERLAPLAPGVRGVVYDMAARGVHIDRVMRTLGWLVITKVPAAENRFRRTGPRMPPWVQKERAIEVKDLDLPDGPRRITLHARGGALGIGEVNEVGDPVFVPLERTKTLRRQNRDGTFRFCNDYRLPAPYGGGELRVRLTGNEEDRKRGLNRAENLRAIPPSDPDFARLFSRRNDAESINRALEDTLYIGRAHSVGRLGQQADLLGFALMVNSLTLARHRVRERLKAAA
jgi:hypothetical protein